MGWLMQKMCAHEAKNLVIETSKYSDGDTTSRIICCLCKKVIVPSDLFDDLKAVLTTAST